MGKYKIVFKRKECIGAGECEALSPELWKLRSDGKADLNGATHNDRTDCFELEIDESQYPKERIVAGSCPIGCIKIEKC